MVLTVVEFQPLDLPNMDTVFSHLVFDVSQPHWFLSVENVNIIIIVCAEITSNKNLFVMFR